MAAFEVIVLEKPKKKDAANGSLERLVLGPVLVIATDTQSAALTTMMNNADMKIDKSRMDVQVRPFM